MHSGWLWMGHSRPSFANLLEGGSVLSMPFRVIGVMLAEPLLLSGSAARMKEHGWRYEGVMFDVFILSSVWCFMNGIVLVVSLGSLMTI